MHKEAAKNTAKVVLFAVLASLTANFIFMYVPVNVIIGALVAGTFAFIVSVFYSFEKHRLETIEKIRKMD